MAYARIVRPGQTGDLTGGTRIVLVPSELRWNSRVSAATPGTGPPNSSLSSSDGFRSNAPKDENDRSLSPRGGHLATPDAEHPPLRKHYRVRIYDIGN